MTQYSPLQIQALKHQLQCSLEKHLKQAESALQCSLSAPEIFYNVRGKVAGKAYLTQWQIRLNPVLLIENPQAFVEEVIPHELAHLVAYHQFGRVKPHGKEWQYIMTNVFGVAPQTCHQFDVTSVQGKTFPYRCQCQDHQLTIRRHNNIIRNKTTYRCMKCGSQLVQRC
ncbi:MAG: SprT family zinc-dependent metalloprotease [Vibrio sp.]